MSNLQFAYKQTESSQPTGPRPSAGFENSKYNATRHGLSGSQIVVKGENPAEYDKMRAALVEEHKPASEEQAMLVERIAQCWWKIARAERYEREFLNMSSIGAFGGKSFDTFHRYRTSNERSWNRARKELAELKRQESKQVQAESHTEPKTVAQTPPSEPEPKPAPPKVAHAGSVLTISLNEAPPAAPAPTAAPPQASPSAAKDPV